MPTGAATTLRSAYITNIWRNSHLKEPTVLTPEGNCWNLIDGQYVFNWFDGDTVPSSIYEILIQQSSDTAEDETSEGEENILDNIQLLTYTKVIVIIPKMKICNYFLYNM